MSNAAGPDTWKFIWVFNSTKDTNLPNEAMLHIGHTNTKFKASIFFNHYTRVSKLLMTKEDCDFNHFLTKHLNTPSIDYESCSSNSMTELLSAMQKKKCKRAAGPDDISPTFLKLLNPLALQELLSIFNVSFHHADCPLIWRVSIIPLLTAGKSPSDVAYFRPVSLISCTVKLLEGIIANQLYCITKSNHLLSCFQAGFCKDRSCEDHILCIVQAVEDGFQQHPM